MVEAVTSLYEFRPRLLTYAYRLVGNPEDAADIVQEAMLKALSSPVPPDNLRAWLYSVTHNIAVDHLRRSKNRSRAALDLAAERALWLEEDPARADSLIRIERAVRGLPSPYLEAVVLKFLQHFSYEEISEILKTPVGTIKARVARGLDRIRKTLGGKS
jgi:RNA polymerase sigma-70 factor (ECF subfamily)